MFKIQAAVVAALVSIVLGAASAHAQTGSISGTLVDTQGTPIASRPVSIHGGFTNGYYNAVLTDAAGAFSFTGLAAGTYTLAALYSTAPFLPQIYGTSCPTWRCTYRDGAPIAVANGQAVAGITFALSRGGSIAGHLFDAATSAPLPLTAPVQLFDELGYFVDWTYPSFSTGEYTFAAIPPGKYHLLVKTDASSGYVGEFADGRHCTTSCDVLRGVPFQVVENVVRTTDVTLDRGGRITGRLINHATGQTITFGNVTIRSLDGNVKVSTSPRSPSYEFEAVVPPGTYAVVGTTYFDFVPEYYGGVHAACLWDAFTNDNCDSIRRIATPVTVAAGATTSGIDIRLDAGGTIAGSLTVAGPVSGGVTVSVLTRGGTVLREQSAMAPGNYTIRDLPPGTHYVCATTPYAFKTQAYGGAEFATASCPPAAGTPVTIVAGVTTSSIDLVLNPARTSGPGQGTIRGTVRQSNGQPVAGSVSLTPEFGTSVWDTTNIASDGTYSFNMTAGRYMLKTSATGNFADEWYGGACALCPGSQGTAVTVTTGATTSGIDFVLEPGATIQGTVSPSTSVLAYDATGRRIHASFGSPVFSIVDLPAGTYYLRTDSFLTTHADVIYPDIPCLSKNCAVTAGTPVTVASGQTVTNINLTLPAAGLIRGRAILADGTVGTYGQEVRAFTVEAFDVQGQPAGYTSSASGNGVYEIRGLLPGPYFVRTVDGPTAGAVNQAWRDVICADCAITDATPVIVQASTYTSNIDFLLTRGGTIRGLVVESGSGLPLDNQRVEARTKSGNLVSSALTALDGSYVIQGMPDGEFYVQTATSIGYVDQRYPATPCVICQPGQGSPVAIVSSGTVNGINFALVKGGRISGRVTADNVGIEGARVSALDAGGTITGSTVTDASGSFVVAAPIGGGYAKAEASGYQTQAFDRQTCAGGVCNLGLATAINVLSGQMSHGVNFPLAGCAAPAVLPGILPASVVSHTYSTTLSGAGGAAPYRFSLSSGSLPPSLALNQTTGALSGSITQAGSYAFTIAASDALGCSTQKPYTLEVKGCGVSVSTEHLSFLSGGGQTSVQIAGACSWQASTTSSWIAVTPGPSSVIVAVAANAGDTRYGRVIIGDRSVEISQASLASGLPFGAVDVPNDGATVRGSIAVGGWALDDVAVQRIAIYRDAVAPEPAGQPIYIGDAVRVRGARPDVEALFPHLPLRDRAGWGFLLLTNMLPGSGNGTFRLHAYAVDVEGHNALLGSRTIVAANAGATAPFGAIDTPAQGATISGSAYINFGWALTPVPKTIPLDGSTITVFVDGVSRGTVDYSHYRADIATLFPGYHNSPGAVGFKILDTTQLANGIHTISWTVTDNAGATEGIGSRYFHVDNSSSPITAAAVDDVQTVSREMPAAQATVDLSGTANTVIRAREMERITIDLRSLVRTQTCVASYSGSEIVGDDRRPLPAGSSLDSTSGAFAWQPGPGFLGRYQLLFTAIGCDGSESTVPIDVRILRAAR